ncbi:MAG: S1-like domain-containing RNA-binding protein [Pseudomonadales bacterium]
MVVIGGLNQLRVIRETHVGVFLDGDPLGEILLPSRSRPADCQLDTIVEVFIYLDSEDRLVATTDKPYAMVGEFAWLTVVSVNTVGAFLDWGLPKDLLLPYAEQQYTPEVGRRVMVRVYLDNTNRLAASTRIDDFLKEESSDFKSGQQVQLLIADSTELGYKAIVDNSHWGVLYNNELFQPLTKGQRITGTIKKIRADKKIDLTLSGPGHGQIEQVSERIVNTLKQHDGFMMITDKSPPETIYSVFKVSKKVYKKAVGALYKQRRIDIEKQGIRLLDSE